MTLKYIPISSFIPENKPGEYGTPSTQYFFQINEPHLRFVYLGSNPRVLLAISTHYQPTPAESLINNFSNFLFPIKEDLFTQAKYYYLPSSNYFDDQGNYQPQLIEGLYYFVA